MVDNAHTLGEATTFQYGNGCGTGFGFFSGAGILPGAGTDDHSSTGYTMSYDGFTLGHGSGVGVLYGY